MLRNPVANAGDKRDVFNPRVRKIPWRRKLQHTPVFMPGKSHGGASRVTVYEVAKSWTQMSTHTRIKVK